jgi:hypothetical protein
MSAFGIIEQEDPTLVIDQQIIKLGQQYYNYNLALKGIQEEASVIRKSMKDLVQVLMPFMEVNNITSMHLGNDINLVRKKKNKAPSFSKELIESGLQEAIRKMQNRDLTSADSVNKLAGAVLAHRNKKKSTTYQLCVKKE